MGGAAFFLFAEMCFCRSVNLPPAKMEMSPAKNHFHRRATGLPVKIIYFCRLLRPDDHFLCLRKLFFTACKNDFASSDIMGQREYK